MNALSNADIIRVSIEIILFLITLCLHLTATFILSALDDDQMSQRVIFLNLCIIEVLLSMNHLVFSVSSFYPAEKQKDWYDVLNIVQWDGLWVVYLLIMMLVTSDRFCEVYLNIKYQRYFSRRSIFVAIAACWLCGAVMTIIVLILRFEHNFDYEFVTYTWVFQVLDGILVVWTISVYAYFYSISRRAKKKFPVPLPSYGMERVPKRENINFQRPTFLVPIFIVTTFVCFMYIPDIIYVCLLLGKNRQIDNLKDCIYILYSICMSSDAFIIFYFNRAARIRLMKIICPAYYSSRVRPALIELACGSSVKSVNQHPVQESASQVPQVFTVKVNNIIPFPSVLVSPD